MQRYDRPRRILAYSIAGLAGFVDATGYLAADRYFVSFMSGNTTRLGVDIVTNTLRAYVPAFLILGFVIAVACGALIADIAGNFRKAAVTGASATLIGVGAIAHSIGSTTIFVGCLLFAMGVLNNAYRRDGEVSVAVTYMTGALVRFGQGIAAWLQGRTLPGWAANAALWFSLATGAVCGTLASINMPSFAAWLAAILAACLFLGALWVERTIPAQST